MTESAHGNDGVSTREHLLAHLLLGGRDDLVLHMAGPTSGADFGHHGNQASVEGKNLDELRREHVARHSVAWDTAQAWAAELLKLRRDLVLLPTYRDLDDGDVKRVMTATWYEVYGNGVLMAPASQLIDLAVDLDDPATAGINVDTVYVFDRIDRTLYRGREADGFYHA